MTDVSKSKKTPLNCSIIGTHSHSYFWALLNVICAGSWDPHACTISSQPWSNLPSCEISPGPPWSTTHSKRTSIISPPRGNRHYFRCYYPFWRQGPRPSPMKCAPKWHQHPQFPRLNLFLSSLYIYEGVISSSTVITSTTGIQRTLGSILSLLFLIDSSWKILPCAIRCQQTRWKRRISKNVWSTSMKFENASSGR